MSYLFYLIRRIIIKKRLRRLYRSFRKIGHSVRFSENFDIHFPERIVMGDNVLIHSGLFMDGEGEIQIGNNFVSSINLIILSSEHNFRTPAMLPWDEKKLLRKVTIEDNVWCGVNVIILPGVTIGEGAVIGAGSVVTQNIEKYAIVAGNPAKTIGYRDIEIYNSLKESGKFRVHPITQTTSDIILRGDFFASNS